MKRILAYGTGERLIRQLTEKGYECFRADSSCLDEKIKDLFEKHEDHTAEGSPAVIITSGLDMEEMRDLMDLCGDVIFAAETETNREWTLGELIDEVCREDRVFRLQKDLREVLQVLGYMAEKDPGLLKDERFRELCTGAYMYVQNGGSDEGLLTQMVRTLRSLAVRIQGD